MTAIVQKTVVGVFINRTAVQEAIQDLRRAGLGENQIGMVAPDIVLTAARSGASDEEAEVGAGKGAAIGAATGAAAGAATGVIAALATGSLMIPIVGPVIAGGALAILLGSIAAGAATGGLVGALMGLDLTEDEARHYEGRVQAGHILVTVQAGERAEEAAAILRRHGGTTEAQKAELVH